jgi:hypothetical protein
MRHRDRPVARPTLESMETRIAPVAMAIANPAARAVAAHVLRVNRPLKESHENQHNNDIGLKRLQQQLAVVKAHSLERTPSAKESPVEQAKTETSSLFKSIFASL